MPKKVIHLNQIKDKTESDIYWRKFGLFLQNRRKNRQLTVEDISKYLGIDSDILLVYESGQKKIPLNIIYSLSNCLDIAPNSITLILKEFPAFPDPNTL